METIKAVFWILVAVFLTKFVFCEEIPPKPNMRGIIPSKVTNPQHYRNTRPRVDSIKFIILHGTGNSRPWADAKFHAEYLDTTSRKVSWHYSVDEFGALQHYDHDVVCFHASSELVNNQSLGVEICHPDGGNIEQTKLETGKLVYELKQQYPHAKIYWHDEVQKIDPKAKIHGKVCPAVFDSQARLFILSRTQKPWP